MSETPSNPRAEAKAAKAYAKATRPWFKKKRIMIPAAIVVLGIIGGIGGGSGSGSDDEKPAAASAPASTENEAEDVAVEADADADAAAAAQDKKVKAEAKKAAEAAKDKKAKAAAKKKKANTVKVSATDLLADYEDNELAADKKYKGKQIQVTGTIDSIDTELFDSDKYVLRISNGDEYSFLTVNCNGMSEKVLSTLTVGEDVTAVGKFDDGGDLGVELDKCELA